MPDRFTGRHPAPKSHARRILVSALLLLTITHLAVSAPALGEIRIVTAQGQHRMGDRDTREDAVRLATEAAKRNALEQVATYLESITVVEGLDVTRDEIRTYTAGLVLVLDRRDSLALEDESIIVTVDLTTQIDTEEVAQAIAALRENEEAAHQLAALRQEIDDLNKELESANLALAAATTPEQVQEATQQRQDILNRVQSNAMVSQAWTDWVIVSPVVYPYPWVGVGQTQALLNVAQSLYPTSPHVRFAQQVIVTKQPPPPSAQPLPSTSTASPPPQQTGTQSVPLMLNEIPHNTQTTPLHLGNQPADVNQISAPPAGSQSLTDVHQLNPLLPPNSQPVPSGTRSARRLQELMPPASVTPPGGPPPVARRLPPTVNQVHPPLPQQVPRVPYHLAPRGSGGGFHGGGGGRGGGGGGRGGGRGR